MVNLDKWEKLDSFQKINPGDKIRVTKSHADGSYADVTGTAVEFHQTNYVEGWNSSGGWRIVSETNFRTQRDLVQNVYRRLPKPFTFPRGVGAVVQAQYKEDEGITNFIFDGLLWVRNNGGASSSEGTLRSKFRNFKTLSEGISK